MEFTCNQSTLAKALNTVSKAVTSRTTLPVLKGILLDATQDNKLVLIASDLEISIKTDIDVDVVEPGSTVVVAKLFSDIIRKLPNDMVTISNTDGTIKIKTNYSEFELIGMPVDEFPSIGEKEEGSSEFVFDKELFRKMVAQTAFAASSEESKGILMGILTEINDRNVVMVSLDGFRLALVNEKINADINTSFVIMAKVMGEVSKIAMESDEDSDIKISLGKKKALFSIGRTDIILRIMEGDFIRYRDIIPADYVTKVSVRRDLLLEGIERASLFAKEGKNNLVVISIVNNLMTITSNSEEGGVKEEVIVEKEGNDIKIGFNSKYVIEVLKAIDEEEISLNLKTSISPCVVRPIDGKEFEYLILPVRI